MCMYVDEIIEVVNDFVEDTKMFTAWDVTTELRKQSKNRIHHYEVKLEVHRIFDQGNMVGYNRTLANLPNIALQPWIYHPLNTDPNMYVGNVTVAALVPTPTSNPIVPSTCSISMTASPIKNSNNVYIFDTTDRLCIPNKLIRRLGWRHGDKVNVLPATLNNNEVIIQNMKKFGSYFPVFPITRYMVDSYDNVRISRTTLKKAGLTSNSFEIYIDQSSETIRLKESN